MDPSLLRPAEQLQWRISSETAKDIDTAKKNLDKCVHILASFQDSPPGDPGKECVHCVIIYQERPCPAHLPPEK